MGKGKLPQSDEEWKKKLTPAQYNVLRGKGTEMPFCGLLLNNKKEGAYFCAGCGEKLFESGAKFESGTGWPSFFSPVDEKKIKYVEDVSLGMKRVEVNCARCGGHLGHVFDDGPAHFFAKRKMGPFLRSKKWAPTHKRYCINSVSLVFKEKR